jgi:integrase
MAIPFNDLAINKAVRELAKSGKGGQVRVDGVDGLSIVVKPSGVASYIVRYEGNGTREGREFRKKAIGRVGVLKLADARALALEIMANVSKGADPIKDARAAVQAQRKALTVRQLFELWEAQGTCSAQTLEGYRKVLEADAFPAIGSMPAAEVDADLIVDVLEPVELRSKNVVHRLRSVLSSIYRFGMQRRLVRANPVAGLGFNHKSVERERAITDDEMSKLWNVFDSQALGDTTDATRIILKLAVLTGQRLGEVAGAEISELRLDGPAPRWTIPAARMKRKGKDAQLVPLSWQAAALFRQALELAKDRGSIFVFPGYTAGRVGGEWKTLHVSRQTATNAMRRARDVAKVHDVRAHDFRRTLTSWLAEQLENPVVLDRILHHARLGVTGKHYDVSTLEGPMRAALQRWADHVSSITGQTIAARSNVVELTTARAG